MVDPLDKSVPWPLDPRAPMFTAMIKHWPDQEMAGLTRDAVHAVAEQRAARPTSVTVVMPGVPGHLSGTPGGPVAYSTGPSPMLTGAFPAAPDPVT
jgi:hypothetical protein